MKETCRKSIDILVTFLLGLLFIGTALQEYHVKFDHIYELTFLSNFVSGCFLLVTGVLKCMGKKLPQVLYLDFSVLLMIVFGVSAAFPAEFTLEGAMFYLHGLNPIALLIYYLLFSNQTGTRLPAVFTTAVMPLAYLIFAVLFGNATGKYIYFFLDYHWYGIPYTVSFVAAIAVGMLAVSFLLWGVNRVVHKRKAPVGAAG